MTSAPANILDQIIEHKRAEFVQRRALRPLEDLRSAALQVPLRHSLRNDLERRAGIIAEIKRRSPSRPEFRPGMDILRQAQLYADGGASGISVLTDERFFGMRPTELTQIREAIRLPILRKDFILDDYGVYESRVLGADAVLLIARVLDDASLASLVETCASCNLEALVEVHDEAELERALVARAKLVGVNSRDLQTFQTDLGVIERLAEIRQKIAPEVTMIAESGMQHRDQLASLQMLGVRGFLIGEALLKAPDPAGLLRELRGEASF